MFGLARNPLSNYISKLIENPEKRRMDRLIDKVKFLTHRDAKVFTSELSKNIDSFDNLFTLYNDNKLTEVYNKDKSISDALIDEPFLENGLLNMLSIIFEKLFLIRKSFDTYETFVSSAITKFLKKYKPTFDTYITFLKITHIYNFEDVTDLTNINVAIYDNVFKMDKSERLPILSNFYFCKAILNDIATEEISDALFELPSFYSFATEFTDDYTVVPPNFVFAFIKCLTESTAVKFDRIFLKEKLYISLDLLLSNIINYSLSMESDSMNVNNKIINEALLSMLYDERIGRFLNIYDMITLAIIDLYESVTDDAEIKKILGTKASLKSMVSMFDSLNVRRMIRDESDVVCSPNFNFYKIQRKILYMIMMNDIDIIKTIKELRSEDIFDFRVYDIVVFEEARILSKDTKHLIESVLI